MAIEGVHPEVRSGHAAGGKHSWSDAKTKPVEKVRTPARACLDYDECGNLVPDGDKALMHCDPCVGVDTGRQLALVYLVGDHEWRPFDYREPKPKKKIVVEKMA